MYGHSARTSLSTPQPRTLELIMEMTIVEYARRALVVALGLYYSVRQEEEIVVEPVHDDCNGPHYRVWHHPEGNELRRMEARFYPVHPGELAGRLTINLLRVDGVNIALEDGEESYEFDGVFDNYPTPTTPVPLMRQVGDQTPLNA